MSTIQVKRPHNPGAIVEHEIDTPGVISDESAVAIASWWQSPGRVGNVLASFASGVAVDRGDLLNDVWDTMRDTGLFQRDLDALHMWVLNKTTYEYDYRNDGYRMVRRAGTDGEWRL